MYQNSSVTTTL